MVVVNVEVLVREAAPQVIIGRPQVVVHRSLGPRFEPTNGVVVTVTVQTTLQLLTVLVEQWEEEADEDVYDARFVTHGSFLGSYFFIALVSVRKSTKSCIAPSIAPLMSWDRSRVAVTPIFATHCTAFLTVFPTISNGQKRLSIFAPVFSHSGSFSGACGSLFLRDSRSGIMASMTGIISGGFGTGDLVHTPMRMMRLSRSSVSSSISVFKLISVG